MKSPVPFLPFLPSLAIAGMLALMPSALFADWRQELQTQLPLLGHRNWIVVADPAYPLQTAPGIRTVYADADQIDVVVEVLGALAATRHVQPTIFTDAEMAFVSETDAQGIGVYREKLVKLLEGKFAQVLPHEEIIAKLDEAGKAFSVLIIKTPLAIPYTSVFFQLECGYWNADAEKRLREAMK